MLFLKKNSSGVALFLIAVIAAILRLRLLGDYTVDRDEYARLVPEFTFTSLIPPGILFLTKFSASIFNYSDFGYRFPIFLFGVLGVVLIYYLGKTFFGKLEGILAAFILAILLNHIVYSNQVKEYVPLISFTTLSSILVFKIISSFLGKKKINRGLYFFYILVSLLAPLFSSYFYFLVIFYQLIIIVLIKMYVYFKKISPAKIVTNFPLNLFIGIGMAFIILLSNFLLKQMNAYFGFKIISPTLTFINNYWYELGYFVTQDTLWTKVFNAIFLIGIVLLLGLKKFRRGFTYIISFTALDFLFTSSLRFTHSAFPLQYIRYHAFLMPTYVIMVVGTIGGLVFLLRKKHFLVAVLIVGFFLAFNVKRAYPMIRWYYEVASIFINPNFKDDGAYLTANLKKGDTLVRVKNFGMDHKFNHVNHYIDRGIFKNVNYAIFPERTAKNNWYAPLGVGDEDEQGFSDYLVVERIKTSLKPNTPLISKLRYYGPFLKTRPLANKDSWQIEASIDQETVRLAIDQDVETVWESLPEVENKFSIDLGEVHTLNSIRFNFYPAYPNNFTLFLSENNLSQTRIFNYDSSNRSLHLNQQIFFPPIKARFITAEIKNAGIREIDIWEIYEDKMDVNKEEVFFGESVKKYDFTSNLDGWNNEAGVSDLRTEAGELKGKILSEEKAGISVSLDQKMKQTPSNFINFALRVSKGQKAALVLKTQNKDFLIKNIELIPNGFLNYYSINLDDYNVPKDERDKIQSIVLYPTDVSDAEFGLDFLSLDFRNLPGIQLENNNSPNGFIQYIPYKKDEDYTFFQIGDKVKLPKGRYAARFKIRVDKVDLEWKIKSATPSAYRMHEYLEPKDTSDSDILYVSLESTRGTFYNSPAYINIHGEGFKEANKYYEFSMPFSSDGKETLFFQAFSPKHRRYPANLFITYPQIERVK